VSGVAAAAKFECTNCGGPTWQFLIAIAALAIAGCSLYVSLRQHGVFMRELRARAKFQLTATTVHASHDGLLRSDASLINPIVEIGLKNTGDRVARTTVINVLVPRGIGYFTRCGSDGGDLPGGASQVHTGTDETLTAADGTEVPAQWIAWDYPRISLKTAIVMYVRFVCGIPEEGSEQVTPMRIKAQADELPDGHDEEIIEHQVRVARLTPPPTA
jgi:hypothetical protein